MNDRESLFHQALDIDNADRRARFLDQACEGNETLRRDLNELLAAAGSDTNLLKEPVSGISTVRRSLDPEERILAQIHGYKILQKLGEGGFGSVYMAEQIEPVSRKVAIKVIKPGMN